MRGFRSSSCACAWHDEVRNNFASRANSQSVKDLRGLLLDSAAESDESDSDVMEIRKTGNRSASGNPRNVRRLIFARLVLYVGIAAWTASSPTNAFAEGDSVDGCPRVALREMIASAADHGDVGDVAAIELEVLRLCNERQKLIVRIVEGEERLAELRGAKRPGSDVAALKQVVSGTVDPLPLPAKVSFVAGAPNPVEPTASHASARPTAVPRFVEEKVAVPEFRWTTVYGSAGNWVAGVTDGAKVWYVRAGDMLPAGIRVVRVRERPPGVRVSRNGEDWQIPGPGGPGTGGKDSNATGRGS